MKKCIPMIVLIIAMIQIVTAIQDCNGVITSSEVPCSIISSWQFPNDCNTYTVKIYDQEPNLLDTRTLGSYGITGRCNITFNYTTIGSYLLNWSTGDSSKIIVEEDNNMLLAMVIGIICIIGLFIFLTITTKEDKPFLAHFFFLSIFIFTTVLTNLLWKIANVNQAPYEPIFLVIYRMMLIITMLMMLIILVLVTIDAVQVRRIKGNPIDSYNDNLGK